MESGMRSVRLFVLIGTNEAESEAARGPYSDDLAKNYISAIRTDLDKFSDAEASILENHGYWLADAAIRKHVPQLLPANVPPLNVPNPAWAGPEEKIEEALKDSGKRRLLGRS